MKRRRLVVLSLAGAAVLYGGVATTLERNAIAAQTPSVAAASEPRVDRDELMRVVTTLSDSSMAGRRTGTPGGLAARRFIRDAFARMGLEPAGTDDFLDPFAFEHVSIKGMVTPGRPWKTTYDNAANVVGRVPARSGGSSRTFVISAHYDHLGTQDGQIYHGADDNASGVAALLAVARYVKAHPLKHAAIFAAFDAEELGLEGSKAFMRRPLTPADIALNINFDMVSRNDRNEIFAAGTYHTPSLKPMLDDVQHRSAVKILFGHDRPMTRAGMVEDWTSQSDHGTFHAAGVPFVYFGVEDHPDYHKPTDTADKIDRRFFGNVADMLVDAVVTLDQRLE